MNHPSDKIADAIKEAVPNVTDHVLFAFTKVEGKEDETSVTFVTKCKGIHLLLAQRTLEAAIEKEGMHVPNRDGRYVPSWIANELTVYITIIAGMLTDALIRPSDIGMGGWGLLLSIVLTLPTYFLLVIICGKAFKPWSSRPQKPQPQEEAEETTTSHEESETRTD